MDDEREEHYWYRFNGFIYKEKADIELQYYLDTTHDKLESDTNSSVVNHNVEYKKKHINILCYASHPDVCEVYDRKLEILDEINDSHTKVIYIRKSTSFSPTKYNIGVKILYTIIVTILLMFFVGLFIIVLCVM